MADQADVFAQLWPNQVYVEGTTGMILTPLGDPTLDIWAVELVDTQDINNPIVLAEATLTVDTRFTFLNADPSTTELEQAGITEMRSETIAAFFNSPAVGSIVLYGTTKHIEVPPFVEGNPPVVFDGFGAMGITADLATAIEEAADLSTAILPDPNPIPKPDNRGILDSNWTNLIQKVTVTDSFDGFSATTDTDTSQPVLAQEYFCVTELLDCVRSSRLNRSADMKDCQGKNIVQVVACVPLAGFCNLAAPECYIVCAAASFTRAKLCFSSSDDRHSARFTQCGSDYAACCLEKPCPPSE